MTAVAHPDMPNGRSLLTSWPRACRLRPERAVEVQRLHTRPLECRVKIRIPRVPELDGAQERLENRLILVVAAGSADGHHRLIAFEHETRRERIAGASAWAQLIRSRLVQPELLAADAHADAGLAENDRAVDPATAWRDVEDVAVFVDDGDMSRVLHHAR